MPIANIQDTTGVEQKLQEILSNADVDRRLQAIRELFVGILDYDNADQLVSLESAGNTQLPKDAYLAARRDGVTVAYIPLDNADTNRVNGIVASAAAKALGNVLGDDLLLVFTNRDRNQLHIIRPDLSGTRPKLQRLVAYRDHLQRTVPQQIANMWDNYGNKGKTLREAIDEAFNVEPVTKDFFETYRWLFEDAKEQIKGFGTGEDEEDQKHLFTQTLFNRLMFVYFLSRKGWLKFKGDTDYLKALWTNYDPKSSTGNFYLTRLRTLFFKGLNNPDAGNLPEDEKALIGEVPFLNGGLFEETDIDKRQNIEIPDETIGHILTELFDRFNFTVMESTPYDVEVAVDPEMLGKVFEELVTGRHDSGAYYTPRPVVSFMCREALKGYLEGKETGLDADAIARFVDEHDTAGISLIGAPRVSEALSDVTVVDPACGSGAYLLGMMQELIELQTVLYNIGVDAKKIYDLKLEIIQRNLYGVDIDEFAVNIAMLRMWLSLAIDYDGEEPEPLPNLDFKVVCGDSLLGPDPSTGGEVQGTLGRDVEKIQRLGQLKADYMRAYSGVEKGQLKSEIEELTIELRRELGFAGAGLGVVDWQVAFAEIFSQQQGFDIAIANPPYVMLEQIGPSKPFLTRQYGDILNHRSDLYCYFYVRALDLLREHGRQVFVCSNTWLDTEFGESLQAYLLSSGRISSIFESAVERQFSTAAVNTIVSVIEKTPGDVEHTTKFVTFRGNLEAALENQDLRKEVRVAKSELEEAKYGKGKWGGRYLRAPSIYNELIKVASKSNTTLSDFVTGERYLNTGGADGFFILTDVSDTGSDLMKATIRSKEGKAWGNPEFLIESQFLMPGFRSTDSTKLRVEMPDCHVLVIPEDVDVSSYEVSKYLAWGEQAGFNERSVTRTRSPWWRPQPQSKSGAPILWPRTHAETHKCYYNPDELVSLRFFRLHPKSKKTNAFGIGNPKFDSVRLAEGNTRKKRSRAGGT